MPHVVSRSVIIPYSVSYRSGLGVCMSVGEGLEEVKLHGGVSKRDRIGPSSERHRTGSLCGRLAVFA